MIQLPGNDDVAATAEGNSSLYSHRRRTTQTPKDIRKSLKFNTNMSFSSYSVPQGVECFSGSRFRGFPSNKNIHKMTSPKRPETLEKPSRLPGLDVSCIMFHPRAAFQGLRKRKPPHPTGSGFPAMPWSARWWSQSWTTNHRKSSGSKQFRMCGHNISCNFWDLWSATSFRKNRFMQHTPSNLSYHVFADQDHELHSTQPLELLNNS